MFPADCRILLYPDIHFFFFLSNFYIVFADIKFLFCIYIFQICFSIWLRNQKYCFLIFIIFKIPIGGIPSYVRPILMPMTLGIIESKGYEVAPEHEETIKALYGKDHNVSNFFGQCLFAANSSVLLIQSTLASIGYEVDVMQIVAVQIPVALFAMLVNATQTLIVDGRMVKKYYPDMKKKAA